MSRRHHREPWQWIGLFAGRETIERALEPVLSLRKLAEESLGDLRTNFIAARADRGADRGNHVSGFRSKLRAHSAQSFHDNASQRATPPGMDRGNNVPSHIRQ